jgi:hypothetical protein
MEKRVMCVMCDMEQAEVLVWTAPGGIDVPE